jgi:hypothetical protein
VALPRHKLEDFAKKHSQGKHETALRSFRHENGFIGTFDFGEVNHRHS